MRKTNFKQTRVLGVVLVTLLLVQQLSGCAKVHMTATDLKRNLSGISVTIRTFDEESNIIDRINGKSVNITRDTTFDSSSESKDSSVIKITVGSNEINHVGSSLVMADKGLNDIFDEYKKSADIENSDSSVPVINRVVHSVINDTTGKKRTVLIRSQNGTPLATYMGDKVSTFSVDIPKTTAFLIDGKLLIVYRCDYTVYDTELLLEE